MSGELGRPGGSLCFVSGQQTGARGQRRPCLRARGSARRSRPLLSKPCRWQGLPAPPAPAWPRRRELGTCSSVRPIPSCSVLASEPVPALGGSVSRARLLGLGLPAPECQLSLCTRLLSDPQRGLCLQRGRESQPSAQALALGAACAELTGELPPAGLAGVQGLHVSCPEGCALSPHPWAWAGVEEIAAGTD